MSENKKYYYLKLKEDFFDSEDIKVLESMENGYLYSNILLKMYLKSLKNKGELVFKDYIPYDTKMLSIITGHNIDIVDKALCIFKKLGFIDVMDNGTIFMLDIQKMIGSISDEGKRKAEYRERMNYNDTDWDSSGDIKHITRDIIALPNGKIKFIDEKRYSGNGIKAYQRANGKCEICGTDDNLCIHHKNKYSNDLDDLIVVCRK